MPRILVLLSLIFTIATHAVETATLQPQLEKTYLTWRSAMISKNFPVWQNTTCKFRQVSVQNMLASERRAFPASLFATPAVPPALTGLKAVSVKSSGSTAKAVYYGKIDFGVGGQPTDNLLVLSFILENSGWKYDTADFINLNALPGVRKEIANGDISYITKTKEFQPTGIAPIPPVLVPPAQFIAKVYSFCPGRMVDVTVNKISNHHFGNAKEAETIIGGARLGANTISYNVKGVPGGKGNEAFSLRVYVLSQVNGVKPIKAFEYQVQDGDKLKQAGSATFTIDAAMVQQLSGK